MCFKIHFHLFKILFFKIFINCISKFFYSKTSFELDEINPILESSGYKKVNQKDKLAKVYSRPNVKGNQMKSLKLVSDYLKNNKIESTKTRPWEARIANKSNKKKIT